MIEDIASQDNDKTRRKPVPEKTPATRRRSLPKKITESYLHNAGLHYLGRFAASSARFRAVMMRKVKRSCDAHKDQDAAACAALVDALVRKFESAGLLGDDLYARGAVQSLRRRGKSRRHILEHLKTKGIDPALALEKLASHDADEHEDPLQAERQAALIYARKKKLGPFRTRENQTAEKELSSMARAGFSYETVRFVLNTNPEDESLLGDMS